MMDGGTADLVVLQLGADSVAYVLHRACGSKFEHYAKSDCSASPSACWVLRRSCTCCSGLWMQIEELLLCWWL